MLQIIKEFICSIITSFVLFYAIYKLSKVKLDYKSLKFWSIIVIYSVYLTLTFQFASESLNIIRIFLNYILLLFFSKYLLNEKWIKIILYSFFSVFLLFVSEFICMALLVYGLKIDSDILKLSFFGSFYTNITIAIITFVFLNIMKCKDVFNKLFKEIYIKKNKSILLLTFITIFIFIILVYSLYFELPSTYSILLNLILVITFAFLMLNSFYETNVNAKLRSDYEIVINDLNDYERMLKEKRKLLHNKENDLISIRGLIKGKNKQALDYIDEALNENYTDDVEILNKVKYIPSGGLQGLIYKKVLKMQSAKVNVILNVDKNIRKIDIIENNINKNKTVCTVIGILLDNAYEAAICSKEKIINIQVFREKNSFNIVIENSYSGSGDMSKIDEQGYSTKGSGRGFGLDFVKEAVNKNKWLVNERKITGNIFTQIVKIKISKK